MAITLKNKSRQMHVINLPHAQVCSDEDGCGCQRQKVGVQDHNPKTGDKTLRAVHLRLGDSVTLCAAGTPGDTAGPLPNAVARLPEVAALIRAGKIAYTLVPAAPAAEPAAPAPAEAEPLKVSSKKPAVTAAKE